MKAPFDELADLVIAMCTDATFWRLLILIAVVTVLLLIAEVHCATVLGFVGLSCLAAMLEVTLRPKD